MPRRHYRKHARALSDLANATPTASPQVALELAESAGVVTKLSGGRLSRDYPQQYPAVPIILPPPNPEGAWEFFEADTESLKRFSASQILDWLVDLSPDVSKAAWDTTRLCNPSWKCSCFDLGSNRPSKKAQVAIEGFFQHLTNMYGSIDVLWNEMFMQAFMRGAIFSELVLDQTATLPIDWALPDPSTARFKRELDPVRGPVWVLGQLQLLGFIPLARPTIRYVAIDKMPGVPYGRPLVSPALFPTLFLLTLMHDLRRVIGQQGYPRLDISINMENLLGLMPKETRFSPAKAKEWINATIAEIKQEYAYLAPDDAFVHTDGLTLGSPIGTVDASSLGGIQAIINVLERMSVRALKSMPIMMGITDGSSEANANRQWEIETTGIASLQHLAEVMIEALLELALRASGIQANVIMRFDVLRATQALRDAQTEQLVLTNNGLAYDRGWISQDEAALKSVGHTADVPEPREIPTTENPTAALLEPGAQPAPSDTGVVNPEPGADRMRSPLYLAANELKRARLQVMFGKAA